jgi:hypothetical protein
MTRIKHNYVIVFKCLDIETIIRNTPIIVIAMAKQLWGFVGDQPFLGGGLPTKKGKRTELWFAKLIHEDDRGVHIALENPPYTAFEKIPPGKLVSTQDVAKACVCSTRTVARHVAYGRLRVHRQVGNDYLFLKKDVSRWLRGTSIKKGRPKKVSRRKADD